MNKLELFNEFTNVMAIDVFLVLTDIAKGRKDTKKYVNDILASAYIALIVFNVSIHMSIMIRGSIRDFKILKLKKKWDKWFITLPEPH
jgi:hypothetical protein